MARLPDSFLHDLLERTDLVALIGERVPLKRAGRDFQACCPFHEEGTASFTVSPAKGFYHCFGCKAHGTAITWLIEYEKLEFREAVETLARRAGMSMPSDNDATPAAAGRERGDTAALLAACNAAAIYFREQLQSDLSAQEYLLARGISPAAVRRFGIGFAPDSYDGLRKALASHSREVLLRAGLLSRADNGHTYDKFRGRIMFPILDKRGRTIAFGGRTITPGAQPKYLNSPETPLFQKGRELFGLSHACDGQRPSRLIVVEGYIDVTALDQAGIPNVVATLGTSVTEAHVAALFAQTDDVVFCFDGDPAGRRAAWRAVETVLPVLRDGWQASFAFLPAGEDPDSLVQAEGADAFSARLADATPLSEYLFDHLQSEIRGKGIEAKARLAQRALPLLERLPQGVFRRLMLARLSELAGTSVPDPSPATPDEVARRTPVREAIALLLRSPKLAAQLRTSQAFGLIPLPGAKLLAEIIDYGRAHPLSNTEDVLAHFSERDEAAHLRILSAAPFVGEDDALLGDLQHALGRLDRAARERRIKLLQEQRELDRAERSELANLLRFDRDARRRGSRPSPVAGATRH